MLTWKSRETKTSLHFKSVVAFFQNSSLSLLHILSNFIQPVCPCHFGIRCDTILIIYGNICPENLNTTNVWNMIIENMVCIMKSFSSLLGMSCKPILPVSLNQNELGTTEGYIPGASLAYSLHYRMEVLSKHSI